MAGAGQLLRELLRQRRASFSSFCRPRPVADSSRCTCHHEPLQPSIQQAVYLHSLTDDEKRDCPPPGMPRCLPKVMASLKAADPTKSFSRTFSGDSSPYFTTLHVRSSASSILSQFKGSGISRHFYFKGHSPAQVGRHCSTVSGSQLEGELGEIGVNAEGFNVATTDVAGQLGSSEVQAISEVSAIIGDCSYPTAFVQILMDNVHTNLGLPWWGAIAVTTIGIRLLCLPIVAFQLKSTAKLSLMRPKMEIISERIKASNYDPRVSLEGREQMTELFKEYKTTPLSPFIGALLQAPIFLSFFFAIQNMCEKLESFKHGGLLLFTDLTAKDTTYILPITMSAAMLLAVELNAAEGLDGNPYAAKMKTFLRIFALVLCPISMNFEMGLFFYWIPSNLFSIVQSFVFKQKAVKEFVGIPSTEHLATSSTAVTLVEPALPDSGTMTSVAKRLGVGRSKSKRHRRR